MATGRRTIKYTRRSSYAGGRSRAMVIVIAAVAFVLLSLIISVVVGISLKSRAEKYALQPKYDLAVEEYYSGDKQIEAVDAYAFSAGGNVSSYVAKGITDFSVCLRNAGGELQFLSSVTADGGEGVANGGGKALGSTVERIHAYGGKVCAYFYVNFFEIESGPLRELRKAYEIALVNEAAAGGVDEIMLIGLDVNESNIDEVQRYVSDMSFAAENSALGVLLTSDVFKASENDVYHASRIRSVCDFVALDLRDLPADEEIAEGEMGSLEKMISDMRFYIRSYNMRVVLSKNNSELYDEAKELGVVSIQIVE